MEFGIGKVDITPPIGTRLIGQPEQLESDGKYTELNARALYLGSEGSEIVIITCDLLFLPKSVMDHLREKIVESTSVRFQDILIHTTHTHAGPSVTRLFNKDNVDPEVSDFIYEGVVQSALHAYRNRRRGFIGYGKACRNDLAFNRRYVMKDGSVELHPFKDDPRLLSPEGPADPEINVMVLQDSRHVPVAAVANFSCHLTSLERNNRKFSADFPYFAEKNLMQQFANKDFVLLYLNGPCGNVCQINVENKNACEVGIEHTERMGKIFSDSILGVIEHPAMLDKDFEIRTLYREINIPIRSITEKMLREAEETVSKYRGKKLGVKNLSNYGVESYRDPRVISANTLLKTEFWKNAEAGELLKLHELYKDDNREIVPLTVMSIGPLLLVTTPAELFVEFSLELKRKFKRKYSAVFVVELVNGWVGYVPTKKAFQPEDGGYEVQFLNSSKLSEDAGDTMVNEIIDMEKQLTKNCTGGGKI